MNLKSFFLILLYISPIVVLAQEVQYDIRTGENMFWNTDNEFGMACYRIEKLLKTPNTDDEMIQSVFREVNCNDVDWLIEYFNLLMEYCRYGLIRKTAFDYLEKKTGDKEFFYYLTEARNSSYSKCRENIMLLRTLWHADGAMMGGLRDWEIFEYIADTYAKENKIEKALRTQKIVLDILRTDEKHPEWETNNTIREKLLNGFSKQEIIDETFKNELNAYIHISDFYEQLIDYEKQCDYLEKAYELANSVICYAMKEGNDMHNDKIWNDYKYVYSYIASKFAIAKKYKPMGDLLLKAVSMRQGFMLNNKNMVRSGVFSTRNSSAIDYYKSVTDHRRAMERDLFKTGKAKGSDILSYDEYLYKLNNNISLQELLTKSISISKEFIKRNLQLNEIFVFFYSIGTNEVRVWGEKKSEQNDSTYYGVHVNDYYAIVMRKNWIYPEIVYLGNDIGADNIGTNFTLEQYRIHDDDINYINKLHADEIFGRYIWDKILKVGAIQNNESIIFVPGGFLNQLAIEILPISDSKRICDVYNVYRLSSSFEINSRCRKYSVSDKMAVFGDMNLSRNVSDKNEASYPLRKRHKKRVTNNSAFINREELAPLEGGHEEIQYLSELFRDRCVIYNEHKGTKDMFFDFNWNSPDYIHISTHGYNFNDHLLTNEEKNIVYGKRDTIYSDAERSLYETGLFLSKSKVESIDNGIITAKELSYLNYNKTKLAVLSACSTGRGQWDAEGVHGLVRGLKIAGVKSIIASLWDVHDEATSILIKAFYKYLCNGEDLRTSLNKAQEDVRNYKDESGNNIGSQYIYASPYFWAGFILVDGL